MESPDQDRPPRPRWWRVALEALLDLLAWAWPLLAWAAAVGVAWWILQETTQVTVGAWPKRVSPQGSNAMKTPLINAIETAFNEDAAVIVGRATVTAFPDTSTVVVRFRDSPIRLAIDTSAKSVSVVDDTPTVGRPTVAPEVITSATAADGAAFYANVEEAFAVALAVVTEIDVCNDPSCWPDHPDADSEA